ncbi:MAG: hypothetical protein DME08_21610 [Candidatus Rokuibacteriota bacterium]|nr:MAG: hypothetical protein DME08_21610 [Candidatus Rokubacteria bacterium]
MIAPVVAVAVLASAGVDFARAQSFYEGKTVRINVGFAAGGGYDTYARLISRHLGKHIPGNPTLIVDNMPGAGSLIAANQDVACAMTKASGITSLEKWMAATTPVKLGGVAPGAAPDNTARILKAALGLPIQLVSGYKGTAEIRLAAEGGEIAGACWAWDSMKVTWRQALDAGAAIPVLQVVAKKFPDLPNVPLAITFAKTDEARQLIQVGVQYAGAFARPFALPPGTPRERVQEMRRAFQETLKDRALLAEAEKTRLTLDPVTGEELEKMVADVFTLDPALAAKLKAILYN